MMVLRENYLWVLVLTGVLLVSCEGKVNPKIKCTEDTMRVEIPQSEDIRSIYLEGLKDYPDKQCHSFAEPNTGLNIIELSLTNIFQCGVTRMLNKITGKRIYYHRIIIETTNVQIPKEILNVKCVIGTNLSYNHSIAKRNVLPAGFQEPEDLEITTTLLEKAPEPILGVNVRQGGVPLSGGQLHVAPGTPLQMEIFLDKTSSPIYGLLVSHMLVTDTGSQEETIIYNGCSVDPYLFDNFNTVDGDFLTAKFRAFKFPESTYVQFRGTVNVCLDKCKGIECSNGVVGFGRRKREISSLPADPNKIFEITITSFIKVNYDDESENFESLFKNQTNKRQKFITGLENPDPVKNTIKETNVADKQLNLGQGSAVEEIQYTAIVAESKSGAIGLSNILFVSIPIYLSVIFAFANFQ